MTAKWMRWARELPRKFGHDVNKRSSIQTLGEGEGCLKVTLMEELRNVISTWWELRMNYVKATEHNIKGDHFYVLAKGKTDYHCKIKETLFIQKSIAVVMLSFYCYKPCTCGYKVKLSARRNDPGSSLWYSPNFWHSLMSMRSNHRNTSGPSSPSAL